MLNIAIVPTVLDPRLRPGALDCDISLGDTPLINRALIRQQLTEKGPFIVRTSDGKEYHTPHSEFIFAGHHNLVIVTEEGLLDIIDPMHVVSIRPGRTRKAQKSD